MSSSVTTSGMGISELVTNVFCRSAAFCLASRKVVSRHCWASLLLCSSMHILPLVCQCNYSMDDKEVAIHQLLHIRPKGQGCCICCVFRLYWLRISSISMSSVVVTFFPPIAKGEMD